MNKTILDYFNFDSVAINLNNDCNLRCKYCFEEEKRKEYMTEETLKQILNLLRLAFNDKKKHYMINIFGGEPTLSIDLIEKYILPFAEENNIKVGITTNLAVRNIGYKLKDLMWQYENLNLLVSIDGDREAHNMNRGGSYDTVVENLKFIKDELGLVNFAKRMEGRMTVCPNNVHFMKNGVKHLIEDLEFHRVYPMLAVDQEWDASELLTYLVASNNLFKYVFELFEGGNNDVFIKNYTNVVHEGLVSHSLFGDPEMCPIFTNNWCAFDYNGDIYPCHQFPTMYTKKDYKLGNIEEGITNADLLNKPPVFGFPYKECEFCPSKSLCSGNCPAENLRMNGNFTRPKQSYCELTKMYGESICYFYSLVSNKDFNSLVSYEMKNLYDNINILNLIKDTNDNVSLTDIDTLREKIRAFTQGMKAMNDETHILPGIRNYIEHVLALIASFLKATAISSSMDLEEEDEDDMEMI